MIWTLSDRCDPKSRVIADRHYNRQSIGAVNFVPPGRCLVLYAKTTTGEALWVTSYPFARYVRHQWAGAWMCSAFRNEGAGIASELIRDAIAVTRYKYGNPPPLGMVTFLDRDHVKPTVVRGHPIYGWTWMKIGFKPCGETKGGLLAFQLLPEDMPEPQMAAGVTEQYALTLTPSPDSPAAAP